MDALIFLLGLVLVVWFLSAPILLILVLVDRGRVRERFDALMRRIAALESQSGSLGGLPASPLPAEASMPAATAAAPPSPAPDPPPPPPSPQPAAPRESFEERLMSRWVVWLGGIALSLGAGFLVKYSVDQGWFGPTARVIAVVLLGLVLWMLSEIARRREIETRLAPIGRPDRVPPALAAAGSVALFAGIYGAHALYDLIGPLTAFALLALVAAITVLLSLLHGVVMAWIGLIGVYAVPALVTTPHPSTAGLLGYVGIATAGSTALLRWRRWVWVGWVALAGALFWALVALFVGTAAELLWPLGIFLLALPLLFVLVADAVGEDADARGRRPAAWVAAALGAFLLWGLVELEDYDIVALGFAALQAAIFVVLAWRYHRVDRLVWIGALLEAVLMACWHFADGTALGPDRLHALMLPPATGVGLYLTVASAIGVFYGVGGFAMLWRAPNPARWAVVSAATPLMVMIAAYWRLEHFGVSLPWAGLALGLAVFALAAVERLSPRMAEPGLGLAVATYAIAMTAAVSLAMTLSLRLGWLTVALALELPALAAMSRRVPSRAFSRIAAIIAAVVLARLLLNPQIDRYGLSPRPILNELLYLYGAPLAGFVAAARLFRWESERNPVRVLLDGGAVALALALASLEIRHFSGGGSLHGGGYGLAEQGLQSTLWLGAGWLLLRYEMGLARPVREIAWRIVAVTAAMNVLLVSRLGANPLLFPASVGSALFFNALLLAYAIPAVLALLLARAIAQRTAPPLGVAAAIAGLALIFLYVTLEVRHLFAGPILAQGEPSDGEWYAYSAAWLAYGVALLGLGIGRNAPMLRLAGLAIGGLVALKAFLFDMAALTGLYRAASFLGLGASLMLLAYLHQRLVARPLALARNAGSSAAAGSAAETPQ